MRKRTDRDRPESLEETGAADDTVIRRALVWSLPSSASLPRRSPGA